MLQGDSIEKVRDYPLFPLTTNSPPKLKKNTEKNNLGVKIAVGISWYLIAQDYGIEKVQNYPTHSLATNSSPKNEKNMEMCTLVVKIAYRGGGEPVARE